MATHQEYVFDLSGGDLALDFVNTVGGMRGVAPKERLHGYGDLVAFGRQSGALSPAQAGALGAEARRHAESAAAALEAAKSFREALYRLFLAVAEGRPPEHADVEALNAALARALPHRRLVERAGRWELAWDEAPALDAVLWPVADAAAALLTSPDLSRVRVCGMCEEDECSWLFMDRTKARTKRWCSMEACGNRAKARRHYRKVKRKDEGGGPSP
jgi:predicted RNA-binding Zn ribbon-like protein